MQVKREQGRMVILYGMPQGQAGRGVHSSLIETDLDGRPCRGPLVVGQREGW